MTNRLITTTYDRSTLLATNWATVAVATTIPMLLARLVVVLHG